MKNVIPVCIEGKQPIPSMGGPVARDLTLKFMLENEVGSSLNLQQFSDRLVLSLISKSGNVLTSVDIQKELPSILGISDKYLYVNSNGELIWKEGSESQPGAKILYDTTQNWDDQIYLISEYSTIYVYVDKYQYTDDTGKRIIVPGIKIGDGQAYLIDKPFITDEIRDRLTRHLSDVLVHIQPGERQKWNNKLNYIDPGESDLLIFTRD